MSSFDPLAILGALEHHSVAYVLVGDLAGVLHGSGLAATTVEITPALKPGNYERLARALGEIGASPARLRAVASIGTTSEPLAVATSAGPVMVSPTPAGTRGFEDLRRAARREALGKGVRAPVASPLDLIRSLSADGRDQVLEKRLRRLVDLSWPLAPDL